MNLKTLKVHKNEIVHVVIETPQYSANKYAYDPDLKIFKLKKTLPLGYEFPFDFGFIPNTVCEDGDPLDVLVLIEGQTYPGCLVSARLVGILEATQTEKNKAIRNDRLIAVSTESQLYADITDLKELNKNILTQIEKFFIDYNKHEGKVFKPLRWGGVKAAIKKIKDCKE
ncbi:MAG: inorganic diphosphatase [Cytophaga sp.]|uniref:inorganic diphosphatase n=1 Tax=Cytophaga sp. TaxID=29535 RepID=UPI003F810017